MKVKLRLKNQDVDCVDITELARMCKRKTRSLRANETQKILPKANFRLPAKPEAKGIAAHGQRVYTLELAEQVAEIYRTEILMGIKVSDETKIKLNRLFQEEREKYT